MACPNDARLRNKTMAFRCTPEEYELVTRMAEASGMNKQDYIMAKLTDTEITVVSNPRTQKAMREWIESLTVDVRRENQTGRLSEHLQKQLTVVLKYFNDLCAAEEAELQADSQAGSALATPQAKTTPVKPDESRIFNMDRG